MPLEIRMCVITERETGVVPSEETRALGVHSSAPSPGDQQDSEEFWEQCLPTVSSSFCLPFPVSCRSAGSGRFSLASDSAEALES